MALHAAVPIAVQASRVTAACEVPRGRNEGALLACCEMKHRRSAGARQELLVPHHDAVVFRLRSPARQPHSAPCPRAGAARAARGRGRGMQRGFLIVRSSSSPSSPSAPPSSEPFVTSAAEAVNLGLELFKKGKVRDALKQFDFALELKPNQEEAQAALYNKACCHAYREEGQKAQAALREALGRHGLQFSVILSDPDLAPFRAMPEFRELQEEARRGGAEVGGAFRRDLKLISEAQAPFRGVRKFVYVAFLMSAGIASFFTVPRVIAALQGGEAAPSLWATLGNLGINLGGGALFVWLYLWDQRKEEEQITRVSRDETLSRLPLRLQSGRLLNLFQLRETTRPVILAGRRDTVTKALKAAEGYRKQLVARGVLLVPVIQDTKGDVEADAAAAAAKKKGFGAATKRVDPQNETLEEFEERARQAAAKRVSDVERRFKAEPEALGEWNQWIQEQQELEGVQPGDDVFILLRLDGRIRKSGKGMPDWADIVTDTPELDSLISKLER